MTASETAPPAEPLINDNPTIQSYYQSLESRIGYRLVLGGTRHFGYWEKDTYWPLPVGRPLRQMEDKMLIGLNLPAGSLVLDAGCGVGHVAMYMAKRGLRVNAIDIVEHHVEKARRNVTRGGVEGEVTVRRMDYHHLESIPSESHDGVYTMETCVHATDPEAVVAGFLRILKPGGHISMFEYEHSFESEAQLGSSMADDMKLVNRLSAMPTNQIAHVGYWEELLKKAGFVDVKVEDYSENIRPMLRLFYAMAIVPYFFLVKILRLEKYFVNTVAGAGGLVGQKYWRYVAVSARKPGDLAKREEEGQ